MHSSRQPHKLTKQTQSKVLSHCDMIAAAIPAALTRCLRGGGSSQRPSVFCARQQHCASRLRTPVRAMSSDGSAPGAEELRGQSCSLAGCSPETPKVSDDELPPLLAAVPTWRLSADRKSIARSFTAKNFKAAIAFFNAVCGVAEAEGHHPDLHLTNYRDVQVVLSTHAIGGLARADFILAAKLDALDVEYSPKWLRENTAAGAGVAGSAGGAKQ